MSKNIATTTAKSIVAGALCAAALAGTVVGAVPTRAYATDWSHQTEYVVPTEHYEGEQVIIEGNWDQPIYAEWHRGESGKWWATFWTYNGTYVYAEPSVTGCWSFHVYDRGEFINVYHSGESSDQNLYGPEGISSHWCNLDGTRWF